MIFAAIRFTVISGSELFPVAIFMALASCHRQYIVFCQTVPIIERVSLVFQIVFPMNVIAVEEFRSSCICNSINGTISSAVGIYCNCIVRGIFLSNQISIAVIYKYM